MVSFIAGIAEGDMFYCTFKAVKVGSILAGGAGGVGGVGGCRRRRR